MRLLYSNILPLQIEEGKETIVEAINSQQTELILQWDMFLVHH